MLDLKQSKFVAEMRWECDEITGIINKYYKIKREHWAYLMVFEVTGNYMINTIDDHFITFAVREPGRTIGYIKCDDLGKIVGAKFYKEDATELVKAFEDLVGKYLCDSELAKIYFVNRCIKMYPKAKEQILWFIANFVYHQGYHDDSSGFISKQFRAGYCLHFAVILKSLFKTGEVCWCAPFGHIVYLQDGVPYDIEGVNDSECDYYIPISYIKDGIKDFVRVPGIEFNASQEYINNAIEKYKKDNIQEG